MEIKQAAEFLLAHDRYLILTHVRPDGDTIGCAAALCLMLRQQGKQAHVLFNPEATTLYSNYLEGLIAPEDYEPATVVTVDIAAEQLIPENARKYVGRIDLAIDHHVPRQPFAPNTCIDYTRAACAELVYDILKEMGPVTREMAVPLYVGISTDCGCFVYGNTNARTHRITADLFDLGIDAAALNKRHFRTKSAKRMKLESMLINGAEFYDHDTVVMGAVTLEMMDTLKANERDAEDIAALLGQIEGVKTAVTIREQKPDQCKISLRTDPTDLDANKVCDLLGGGGHTAAAGATLHADLAETKRRVLEAIHQIKEG